MKVKYIQHSGNDTSVVNAARVSHDRVSKGYVCKDYTIGTYEMNDDDKRLIKYLSKNGHHSPFNHTWITMHIKVPIFVARQLVKHEYMPWNEISRRYVKTTPEFYEPEVWRQAADNVKQGSLDEASEYMEDINSVNHLGYLYKDILTLYDNMIRNGVCPEQARMILPQSMYTEAYWSGTLHAWAKMYNLRIHPHAQRETQEVARQAGEIIAPLFKNSWAALTDG